MNPTATDPYITVLGMAAAPRLEYRGTIFGVRIYEVNAGTIHGGRRPTEVLAAVQEHADRVRADSRCESALVLSSNEYATLAAELLAREGA